MLYNSLVFVSLVSSVGLLDALQAEVHEFEPLSDILFIHFCFSYWIFWVIMSMFFFPFYTIVLYYYKYKLSSLIGLRYYMYTIFYALCAFSLLYRAYRLTYLIQEVKFDNNCKGLYLRFTYFLNTFKNIPIKCLKHNRITLLDNHDSSHPNLF